MGISLFKFKILVSFILFYILLSNTVNAQVYGIVDLGRDIGGGVINTLNFVCDNGNWFFKPIIGAECTRDINFIILLVLFLVMVSLLYDITATYGPWSNLTAAVTGFALSVFLVNMDVTVWLAGRITVLVTTPAGIATLIAITLLILIVYLIGKIFAIKHKKQIEKIESEADKKSSRIMAKAFERAGK